MAKKKTLVLADDLGKELSVELADPNKRPFEIVEAYLKDGFCNYVFQITDGIGRGEKHKVDGAGMVMEELSNAFGKLHVHMATIDGIFQHSKTEVDDIDMFHNHELTDLYYVNGVKIYGSEDNEMVVLTGSKRVSFVGGRSNFVTPKIPLDNLSSYTWHNELAELVLIIRNEVSKYKEGNYFLPNLDEEEIELKGKKGKAKQLTIGDELTNLENNDVEFETTDSSDISFDDDFENAKL